MNVLRKKRLMIFWKKRSEVLSVAGIEPAALRNDQNHNEVI